MNTVHCRRPGAAAALTALALLGALAGANIALAASAPGGSAHPAAASARTGLEAVEKQVQEFTLSNGVKFLVVERHQAPVFSFKTRVNSGAANDISGETGLAHMMEHMAFKGTATVGTTDYDAEKPLLDAEDAAWSALFAEKMKGWRADSTRITALSKSFEDAQHAARKYVVSNGFASLLEKNGVNDLNAYTAEDETAYFYSLPSNKLELWSLLEGSRMAHPVFREFYKERDVVREERRMNYESRAGGRLYLEFIHAAFTAHPYGRAGIGQMADLEAISRPQGEAFYRRNYVAKNMVVSLVGDVTLADVKAQAQKYWAEVSDAPAPMPDHTTEPEQRAERRVLLEDPSQPVLFIGWHIPAITDPTHRACRALANLLAGGEYARLNKILVKEKKIAVDVSADAETPGEKYPHLLFLEVVPAAGQDPRDVEKAVYRAMDEILASKPFTAEELDGYKTRARAGIISAAETNSSLAAALADAQTLYGDWHEFFRGIERVNTLTVDDVMNAMRRACVASNRTVAMTVPPGTLAKEGN